MRTWTRAGVVAWAIYAQVEPFAGVSGDEVLSLIRSDPYARHEIPAWTDAVARGAINQCWEAEGTARPSFADLSETLGDRYCGSEIGGEAAEVYLS